MESKYNSTALADLYTEIRPAGHKPIWLKLIRPKAHNIALSNVFVKPYKVLIYPIQNTPFYKLDRGSITDIIHQLLLLVQKSFEDREQGPLGNIC